jgi:predicted protein tyrosine phosphatase
MGYVSKWFRTYGYAEVLGGFLIGAYPLDADDVATLARMRIERVVNLAQDREYQEGAREEVESALAAADIAEYRFPMVDHGELPADKIEEAVVDVAEWLGEGHHVYLHCRAGWQRSAAVAAGVVALRNGLDIQDALDHVHEHKPSAEPLPHQLEDLLRWWEERANSGPGESDEGVEGDGEAGPGAEGGGDAGAADEAAGASEL